MSTGISTEKLIDLMTISQKHLGKMKWVNLAYDLQDYPAMRRLLNKDRVKFDSGTGIQWNVMVTHVDSAKATQLYARDTVIVGDGMKQANIPWRHVTSNYAVDRREITMNSGATKIVDLMETRRAQSGMSLAKLMEQYFWGKPTDSTDELIPFGVKYWIVSNATEGFNGGNPAGFSDGPGGLNSSTYSQWKNWTGQYAAISSTDLFAKLRKAATFTNFRSPVKNHDYNKGSKYEYYTNYAVLGEIERILELRNDNLGGKIDPYDGRAMFRRTPIDWVPYLEADTTNPFYGINWGVFNPVFLSGEYMREEKPKQATDRHTVAVSYLDCTLNFRCTDRRLLFVLTQ